MRCDFRTCTGNSHLLRNECVAAGRLLARPHGSSAAPDQKRLNRCQRFPGAKSPGAKSRPWHWRLSSSWIAQQHLGPWLYLRGISAVGISALVPFRDRIAGTHGGRSAGAATDAAVGLGARLRRDVGGARDRYPPRRIRARGGAVYRGDTINSRRLARLAGAAPQLGMIGAADKLGPRPRSPIASARWPSAPSAGSRRGCRSWRSRTASGLA